MANVKTLNTLDDYKSNTPSGVKDTYTEKSTPTTTVRDITITEERHNTIFENKLYNSTSNITGSFWMRDRINLLNGNVAYEFNTYRTWSPFPILVQPVVNGTGSAVKSYGEIIGNPEKYEITEDGSVIGLMPMTEAGEAFTGRKSLFNPFTAVNETNKLRVYANAPLLDSPKTRETIKNRNDCSIKALIDATEAGEMGRAVYTWADFMYCKYLGKVSNNYMITLRRFATPPGDHISVIDKDIDKNHHLADSGRMITWMGTPGNDMSSILKYTVKIPYKKFDAKIEEVEDQNSSDGIMNNLMNLSKSENQGLVREGVSGGAQIELLQGALGAVPGIGNTLSKSISSGTLNNDWRRNYDTQKSYGPLDVITYTYQRQGANDGGLEFEQNINLQFDYEMRWYDGVNGKSAMLDLLSNVLQTCYTTGKFWGGAYKFLGGSQSNIYANLPIFAHAGGYTYDGKNHQGYADFGKDVANSINGTSSDALKGVGEVDTYARRETVKGRMKQSSGEAVDALKGLLQSGPGAIASLFYGGLINKLGRPKVFAINSLLTDAPTGLWHLTIGNPKAPIMSMGNMFIDSCEIEHYGPLGIDDFPTGLRVKVIVKHAKPRDNSTIERMYLHGDYRIYTPMGSEYYKMYENAALMKSRTNFKKNIYSSDMSGDDTHVINSSYLTNDANTPSKDSTWAYDGTDVIYESSDFFDDAGKARETNYLMRYFGSARDKDTLKFTSMEALFGGSKEVKTVAEKQVEAKQEDTAQKAQEEKDKKRYKKRGLDAARHRLFQAYTKTYGEKAAKKYLADHKQYNDERAFSQQWEVGSEGFFAECSVDGDGNISYVLSGRDTEKYKNKVPLSEAEYTSVITSSNNKDGSLVANKVKAANTPR